jgi:hypothetical protein
MSDDWYVRKGQKTLGPWSEEQLRKAVAAGRVNPKSAVRPGPIGPWITAARALDRRASEKSPPPLQRKSWAPLVLAVVAGLAILFGGIWVTYEIRRRQAAIPVQANARDAERAAAADSQDLSIKKQ